MNSWQPPLTLLGLEADLDKTDTDGKQNYGVGTLSEKVPIIWRAGSLPLKLGPCRFAASPDRVRLGNGEYPSYGLHLS
jgi:hypothetical protein